ncbi:MAG: hypothetical protein ACRC7N_15390 [Clostridium sp.]
MVNKLKSIASIIIILIISLSFAGCAIVDKGMIKLGFRNEDFEYIKENKVEKIVIQNNRDKGFRFIVTEQHAIKDIYEALASGNPTDGRTPLEPDYVFEIHVGGEVKKYNYVVGVNERGEGNFYDENKAYTVSKHLDQTILQNLSFIRKPRDFNDIYYNSILKVAKLKKEDLNKEGYKIGVNIMADVDCLKYMFSVELEQFKLELGKILGDVEIVNNNPEDYNVVINVKNRGFNNTTFKTLITIDNKKDKIYENFYVVGVYGYNSWEIEVSEANKRPDEW